MKMPGGGPHMTGPGQVTDDSELSMCVLRGIVNGNEENKDEPVLTTVAISKQYGQWMKSRPFDSGSTTRNGLTPLCMI